MALARHGFRFLDVEPGRQRVLGHAICDQCCWQVVFLRMVDDLTKPLSNGRELLIQWRRRLAGGLQRLHQADQAARIDDRIRRIEDTAVM